MNSDEVIVLRLATLLATRSLEAENAFVAAVVTPTRRMSRKYCARRNVPYVADDVAVEAILLFLESKNLDKIERAEHWFGWMWLFIKDAFKPHLKEVNHEPIRDDDDIIITEPVFQEGTDANHLVTKKLREGLRKLSKTERRVLQHFFGFGGGHAYSLPQIATILRTTVDVVYQSKCNALKKLRSYANQVNLRKLYEASVSEDGG